MLENNEINFIMRMKELLIDWLVITGYLVLLFIFTIFIYHTTWNGIPVFSEVQTQIIVTATSVIPIILMFAYLDYRGGSIGKRKANLYLVFQKKNKFSCVIRNIIKFLPWQIAHMGIIHGIYNNFNFTSILIQCFSIMLLAIMFLMGMLRKDKRHIGDFLAGTQVQLKKKL